jgi:hypothetical protein
VVNFLLLHMFWCLLCFDLLHMYRLLLLTPANALLDFVAAADTAEFCPVRQALLLLTQLQMKM